MSAPQIMYYDVFVSFRGKDIRHRFLSHLNEAFQRNNINAFVDDKLERGEEIWPSLAGAIERSSISLIIFSPTYASSHWCLKELVKILKCRENDGRIVIPIFYDVEPTNVRHQLGSYNNAFVEHERKHKTQVQLWRDALNKSANLSGIESSKSRNEAELIKEIVNLVLKRLAKPPVKSKGLVGIDEKIATIESLIRKEPKDTRLIGIWGMGGIGKTTLAEEIFNKLHSEYKGCYFLAHVREESEKQGILSLKKNLFSGLLECEVKIFTPNSLPEDIVRRTSCMKVFIVLDDVYDLDHLEILLGTLDNFGSGSRIIVTTRDKQVLNKANEIYPLGKLHSDKALELFNLNAFNQNHHQWDFSELSRRVINYAQGIPLVVKVLARLLHGKNKEEWESMLGKLKKMPPPTVHDVMKLSYDSLDRKEQHIFLDLACFFLRIHQQVNVGDLKSLLKDNDSDNSVAFDLRRMEDKALITFCEDNTISMHDSLQEMAWEIVRQECIEHPGSRSRLWDPDDIYEALKNDKVTEAIRSIRIDLSTIKEQKLMPHIFAKMSKLKFLEISGNDKDDCYQLILAAESIQFLTTELRFLCWDGYPLKSLPENFSTEKLVILKLRFSKLEKLWNGVKNVVNLKELDLGFSKMLKELPDLSKAINLEVLVLNSCHMLTSVHPSIFSLAKLEKLNLCACSSLTKLGSDSHLCNLSYLDLFFCKNLTEFSLISENMKELILFYTKVKALPSSFGYQSKLELLDVSWNDIERLPSSINNLTQLLHLTICDCNKLQAIPELPPSLQTLYVMNCKSLKTVSFPSTAVVQLKENRKMVRFCNCLNLDEHSLVAIGLNAQINVMRFANQHLSAPSQNHVQNYNDYEVLHSYQAVYRYPGSIVPEWLEYKTTKDYIIIDLSSAPPSPHWGFIFCFVLGKCGDKVVKEHEANITISDVEAGEGEKVLVKMGINSWDPFIESDKVCVMYDQRCSGFLNSRAKNLTRFKIQVKMEGKIEISRYLPFMSPVPNDKLKQDILKGFGVSPISTSSYKSFIQQMELRDSMSQFH